MADYQKFKEGGVEYPLSSSTTNSLLQDADKVIYKMLDYYDGVLTYHIGARLAAEATIVGLSIPTPVAYKVPIDVTDYLTTEQFKFPLLSIFRTNSDLSEKTAVWHKDEQTITLLYILPPLTGAHAERILPIMTSIVRVINNRTEQGFDPSYNSGERVWASAGLEKIAVESASYGRFETSPNMYFPTVMMKIRVTERNDKPSSAFSPIEAADFSIDCNNDDVELEGLVRVSSDTPIVEPG